MNERQRELGDGQNDQPPNSLPLRAASPSTPATAARPTMATAIAPGQATGSQAPCK